MLKTSYISSSGTSPSSAISSNTGGTVERIGDLVADRRREAGEVVEAVAGDVGEAADVDLRAEQLEDRGDVDLGRREQELAERRPSRSSSSGTLVERPAGERVAVRVQARRRQPDQRVAGLDPAAVDDRVERDQPDRAAAELPAGDDLADLGDLAAGDLDPGALGARRAGRRRSGRRPRGRPRGRG